MLGQLSDAEGVLVVPASLDPAQKRYREQPSFGGWLQPGSVVARKVFIPLDILTGRLSYALSRDRKRKAKQSTGLTQEPSPVGSAAASAIES